MTRRSALPPPERWLLSAIVLGGFSFYFGMAMAEPATDREQKHFANSVGMKMLFIPPGSFEMGTRTPRVDGWDEEPAHRVNIRSSFYLSETEVTAKQYRKFRPDFSGSKTALPYATGLSWYDAKAFCDWLSVREGKPYRLPTEAEWEYTARAGTGTPYWSGAEPPDPGKPNPWGLKNVHWDPSEWVADWYGPYSARPEDDPVGPERGLVKVIRGGGLDEYDAYYARSGNRAGYGPMFGMMRGTAAEWGADILQGKAQEPSLPGLVGVWYSDPERKHPEGWECIRTLEQDWSLTGHRGNAWSAQWVGKLIAPVDGEVQFMVGSDSEVILELDGVELIDRIGHSGQRTAKVVLQEGKKYPVKMTYVHHGQPKPFLSMQWSWQGSASAPIAEPHLVHSPYQKAEMRHTVEKKLLAQPGHHTIGFRVVQAALPQSDPGETRTPFVSQCVVQYQPMLDQGPPPGEPWFRKRCLLPTPPENVHREQTRLVGLEPGMMDHNHSPALEVCPNGDLFAVFFTSQREYEPEVSLIATRLRFGSSQWDLPEVLFDCPDSNDISPCLFTEGQQLTLYWGSPRLASGYPFQWTTSADSGASWSQVRYPQFIGPIGPHSRQPINSVLRDSAEVLYVSCDGVGPSSVLWATKDDGDTWWDTGGRTGGRHTTLAVLQNGRILGMGGKSSDINGYMPRSISGDGGKTWQVSQTPFAALGSNQRPCLLRLKSGKLLLCGDFQHRSGRHPAEIKKRGCYVALSDDEGESWRVKKLTGTQAHEYDHRYDTLGYCVARQAASGMIHVITSMNDPCLHFELNEAWILSDQGGPIQEDEPDVKDVQENRETYASGMLKAIVNGGTTAGGAYRLQGPQIWYYENGSKQWEVTYSGGRKVGAETYWNRQGNRIWSWEHGNHGADTWTQYWENGKRKSESNWRCFKAEGTATRWDRQGNQIDQHVFSRGRLQ